MDKLYKIIPFNIRHGNCSGSLVQFQQGDAETNALPFEIGKVLVMSDIKPDDVRGNHAHHATEEILVALTGGCVVDLDDGCGRRESVRLGSRGSDTGTGHPPPATRHSEEIKALLLFPHIWRTMRDFEPGTILMVVANMKYNEADYIRDWADFERCSRDWRNLGGSSSVV